MRRALLIGACYAGLACGAEQALAASPGANTTDEDTSGVIVQRTLYKTFSYQTLSSLDDFAFGYFFGGGIAAGSLLVVANAVSELAVNYAHDLTWAVASQDTGLSEAETRTTRTATYTAINTIRVFGLGLLFTASAAVSLGYVAFNSAADAAVYAANDIVWDRYWPLSDPSRQMRHQSRLPALADYLPTVRVTVRDAPTPDSISIREAPSRDGSFFRIVRTPAAEPN